MMNLKRLGGLLFGIVFVTGVLTCGATKPIHHPTTREMIGNWIGYEADHRFFCRLTLGTNHESRFVVVYPDLAPDLYTVIWDVKEGTNNSMILSLNGLRGAEAIDSSVEHFDRRTIKILLKGRTNTWQRAATLVSEEDLIQDIKTATKTGSKW